MKRAATTSRRRLASRAGACRLIILLVCATCAQIASAQTVVLPTITNVRVGYNTRYKVGFWTPIEITLLGGSERLDGRLAIMVPDGDGVPTQIVSPATVVPGQTTQVLMYAKIGELFCDIRVEFRVGNKRLAEQTIAAGTASVNAHPLGVAQELLLTLGSPSAVEVNQTQTTDGEKKAEIVRLAGVNLLPTRWYGYDGVDWLVLAGSDAKVYRQLAPGDARVEALDEWIRRGGKLLMYVGHNADEILAPQAPLARFAPGLFKETAPLRQTVALEQYAESSEPVENAAVERETALDVARLTDVRGKIEAHEGSKARDLPLVIRTSRGFGEVVFVTVDLDRPPLKNWGGRKQLFKMLLGRSNSPAHENVNQTTGQVTTLGYNDLSGQLRSGLEQFADVKLVPFSIVASLIFVYILFIGPLDYLLVKKVFKRMELTWLTFPAIVALFSLGAYLLAYWLKGDQLHVNRVEVVDFDVASGAVRGTLWSNIFSPQIDAFDLTLAPGGPPAGANRASSVLLAWMGLPGDSFGGMNAGRGNASLFTRPYSFAPSLDALNGMPIAIWSTKGVSARWYYPGNERPDADAADAPAPFSSGIEGELSAIPDMNLEGSLTNNLDVPLTGGVLVYDRWAYPLDRFGPGQTIKFDGRSPMTIKSYFTHGEEGGVAAEGYNARSVDLDRTLETMMLFAVIGENYTRLVNDYQSFIDLSSHLKTGQAILLAHVDRPAAQLLRDGKPLEDPKGKSTTIYRFVFPVAAREASE